MLSKTQIASPLETMEDKLKLIQRLRPIDDVCGSVFFQDIDCTQLLLRAVTGKPMMEIRETVPQSVFRNLFGRGGQLDVLAFDTSAGAYDLEFQTGKKGAVLDRAFFNYSLLARHFIEKGTEFKDFPCTSVVFVQEKDFFNTNQAIAKVRFVLDGTPPVALDSKLDIIYVNTNVNDKTTELGRILHDLRCALPDEMFVPEFKERMRRVKNPKGKELDIMCNALEEYRQEIWEFGRQEGWQGGREEGLREGELKTARKGAASMFFFGSSFDCVFDAFGELLGKDELLKIQHDARLEAAKCK